MNAPVYLIEKTSGISGTCILGEGATEALAWEDAYGPKPWTPYTKKSAKSAWVREVSDEEYNELWRNAVER
jgi:hypothetical protein